MKPTLYIFIVFLLSSLSSKADSLNFEWAKKMGDTSSEVNKVIKVDDDGNVYTAGYFSGTTIIDSMSATTFTSYGQGDIYLSKYNAAGNFIWAKRIGGTDIEFPNSLFIDKESNIYLGGYFNKTCDFDPDIVKTFNLTSSGVADIFIVKLDTSGNLIWAKKMGGLENDNCDNIAVDEIGNVYATGHFTTKCDFDPGPGLVNITANGGEYQDIYISKLDKNGNFVWAKSMGGKGSDYGVSIALDRSNNIYLGGTFTGTADFDPSSSISSLSGYGYNDNFVGKYDSSGALIWIKQIGGWYIEDFSDLVIDSWNNVIITGRYSFNADLDPGPAVYNFTGVGKAFVSKLDSNGNFVWAKKIGSLGKSEKSKSIAVDSLGDIYAIGEFDSTNDFDPGAGVSNLTSLGYSNIYLLKLDKGGDFKWAVSFGSMYSCEGNAIALGKDGTIYSVGSFFSETDFDPNISVFKLTPKYFDAFICKLSQCIINNKTTTTDTSISADQTGVAYQWVECPSYLPVSGATMKDFTPVKSGNYAVILSNGSTCFDTSDCKSITLSGSSIPKEQVMNRISIYPNPANDLLTIDKLPINGTIQLINIIGQTLQTLKIDNVRMNINLDGIREGMYFISINYDSQTVIKKVSIVKS